MNDTEADRDLQRLFATYEPAISTEPFLEQTYRGLNRQIRRARMRSALIYALTAILIGVLAATTARPLNAVISTFDRSLASLGNSLSPVTSQVLIYAATLGLFALARRRLRSLLAPW